MKRKILRDFPDIMSTRDIQSALGIGRSTAYKLLKSGELRAIKVRSIYRIPKAYLEEFINNNA